MVKLICIEPLSKEADPRRVHFTVLLVLCATQSARGTAMEVIEGVVVVVAGVGIDSTATQSARHPFYHFYSEREFCHCRKSLFEILLSDSNF